MSTLEQNSKASGESTSAPHYVRITNGGKIKNWVQFCLKFFEENPGTPVVLHTLPPKPKAAKKSEPPDDDVALDKEDSDPEIDVKAGQFADGGVSAKELKRTSAKSPPATSSIPRLISVSEIIKREYFRTLPPGSTGLYQYNHLGYLEEDEAESTEPTTMDEKNRAEYITAVLEGKNFLKQKRTPYMSITLCTTTLPELEGSRTRQDPQIKKLTKSAKTRLRQRRKKERQEGQKPPLNQESETNMDATMAES